MTEVSPPFRAMTLDAFTSALASGQAVPGGGSAAAVAAALAASLSSMVVRLSAGRPAFQAQHELHEEALAASDASRLRFLGLADEDAAAYAAYRAARGLPRGNEAELAARESAIRRAARESAEVPLAIVQACLDQVQLVERLAGRSNPNASSDLECSALLLEAAARAAAANVIVNLPFVADEAFAHGMRAQVEDQLRRVTSAAAQARQVVTSGATRDPE